jgi:hypothetical protein
MKEERFPPEDSMSLRSPLTTPVAPLSSLRLLFGAGHDGAASGPKPRAFFVGAVAALGLLAVSAFGCSDDGSLVCDSAGTCQICDAYGCRPANPNVGGGGGTSSTSDSTSTSTSTGTGGAPPSCDPTVTTCPCDANNKCADGKQCISGLCIDGCNFSYECGAGKVCANGACVPGCDTNTPCSAGYTCKSGACVLDPSNPMCGPSNPCPTGQICGSNGQCTTACTTNADCASGQVCDGATNQCIPDPSPKPTCDAQKPCPGSQVCQADGFCHYPCTSVTQCKLIDNRFVACDQGICKTDEEVNPECTLSKPCPAGKTCISNKCL